MSGTRPEGYNKAMFDYRDLATETTGRKAFLEAARMVHLALVWTADFPPSAWRTWAKSWLRGDSSAQSCGAIEAVERLSLACVKRLKHRYGGDHPKTRRGLARLLALHAAHEVKHLFETVDDSLDPSVNMFEGYRMMFVRLNDSITHEGKQENL